MSLKSWNHAKSVSRKQNIIEADIFVTIVRKALQYRQMLDKNIYSNYNFSIRNKSPWLTTLAWRDLKYYQDTFL